MQWLRHPVAFLAHRLGGPKRVRVIVTFAAVLGLDGADKGSIGAMAGPLQHAFGIGATDLGLLLTASLLVAAAATFPFGWLVDRTVRIRLLSWSVAGWGAVMALSAFAPSYDALLWIRMGLGAVSACAGPAVASLIGDEFHAGERGSVYGSVLTGEIIGTGVGFLVAGELALWSWRAGFMALAIPAGVLAWLVRRLREPCRGGGTDAGKAADGSGTHRGQTSIGRARADRTAQLVRRQHVRPRPSLVLRRDPARRSLWWAIGYVLRIPTNRILILASALGYFYFTGLRTFGVEYVRRWFHFSHGQSIVLLISVGAGALAGVMVSGRASDRLVARGKLNGRVIVAATAFLMSAGLFSLAVLQRSLWIGIPVLALAAAALGAANPPLDATRLEIMHPALWGRAEAVRTFLRNAAEAGAPISFGYVAEHGFGGSSRSAAGLHATFLVMLVTLAAGGCVALLAVRTYPRDVATALAGIQEAD